MHFYNTELYSFGPYQTEALGTLGINSHIKSLLGFKIALWDKRHKTIKSLAQLVNGRVEEAAIATVLQQLHELKSHCSNTKYITKMS